MAQPPNASLVVLVVDDNPLHRDMASLVLCQAGYSTRSAGDVEAAATVCSQTRVALVVLDVQMPKVSGFDAIPILREAAACHGGHLLILAATALAMANDRARCLAAGFDGYLMKPFTGQELLLEVANLLSVPS